jgi:hypothetical protein
VTDLSGATRAVLRDCDVQAARALWGAADDAQALVMIHLARTAASSMPVDLRAYSHRWLVDRGLPSKLPDRLKPKAERLYPRVAAAVGISVIAQREAYKPASVEIRQAMEHAVLEAEADGRLTDTAFVRTRLLAAGHKVRKKLFG